MTVSPLSPESACVLTAADAAYFPALMALLRSLRRTNPRLPVVVLDGGLTPREARISSAYASVVKKKPFFGINGRGKFKYVSDTSLLKLEACEMPYGKVLWLDADMVVREDLSRIFVLPEGLAGAVPEVTAVKNMFRLRDRARLAEALDMDWDKRGFNAGLFVLRPAEWKSLKRDALSLVERFGEDVFSKSKDQQILNILFSGRTHDLPARYNFSPVYDGAVSRDPAVIHYLSGLKPWHRGYPGGMWYAEFRRNISFAEYPPILARDIAMMTGAVTGKGSRLKSFFAG